MKSRLPLLAFHLFFCAYSAFAQIKVFNPENNHSSKDSISYAGRVYELMPRINWDDIDDLECLFIKTRVSLFNMIGESFFLAKDKKAYGIRVNPASKQCMALVSLPGNQCYTVADYYLSIEELSSLIDTLSFHYTYDGYTREDYYSAGDVTFRKWWVEQGGDPNDNPKDYYSPVSGHLPPSKKELLIIRTGMPTTEALFKQYQELKKEGKRFLDLGRYLYEYTKLIGDDGIFYYVNSIPSFGYLWVSFWNRYIETLRGQKGYFGGARIVLYPDSSTIDIPWQPDCARIRDNDGKDYYDSINSIPLDYDCIDVSVSPELPFNTFVGTFKGPDGKIFSTTCMIDFGHFDESIPQERRCLTIKRGEFHTEEDVAKALAFLQPRVEKIVADKKALEERLRKEELKKEKEYKARKERESREKAVRKAELINKYGEHYASLILQGRFEIGMTKSMCFDMGFAYKTVYVSENEEVYQFFNISRTVCTFVKGKLYSFQNKM